MFIRKELYLFLFALFAMAGIEATQSENLLKREDSSTVILAVKKGEYGTVDELLDKKSITWNKDDVNELIHSILVSEADLTNPGYSEKIFTNLFSQHAHMIDLGKRYNGDREDTLFIEAAKLGSIVLLKLIKEYFPEVKTDQKNKLDQTAFMYACFNGELETVKYLIKTLKANIYLKDIGDYTGFMRASERGRMNVVAYLLEEQKIQLNQEMEELKGSIRLAIQEDHSEVVRYLLQKFKGELDKTEINDIAQYIAQCGADKTMKAFLDIEKFEKVLGVESKDPAGKIKKNSFLSALIEKGLYKKKVLYHQEEGKLAILKLLVGKKKIDLKNEQHIVTPVEAIMNNQFAIAKYLIAKTDFKVDEKVASKLFELSATYLRTDILGALLQHDKVKNFFSLTREGTYNRTFLDYIIRGGIYDDFNSEERVAMLEWLDANRKINLEDKEGKQVVLLAAESNQRQIVKEIFPKIKAEWTSEEIHELFYKTISDGSYKIVKLLLQNSKMKSAFNITTKVLFRNEQLSCLDIFTSSLLPFAEDLLGQVKILALLVKHGKIDFKNKEQNEKIWFTACSKDKPYMLQYLLQNNIVEPTITNNRGQNGLIVAIVKPSLNALSVVKFLARNTNIKIDEEDSSGKTAYDYAVQYQRDDIIEYIESIKKGLQLKSATQETANQGEKYQSDSNPQGQIIQEIKISDTDDTSQEDFKEEKKLQHSDDDSQYVQKKELHRIDHSEKKNRAFWRRSNYP